MKIYNFSHPKTGAGRMRIRMGAALLALAVGGTACDLNLTNPNAPTEAEVLTSIEGTVALSLGMQDQFASSILTYVRAPALVTDEWGTQTRALAADQALFTGGEIDPSFGVVSAPYFATYRVIRSANTLITGAPALGLERGLETGIVATAELFKAMALGMAIQHYERVPTDAAIEGAVPQDRATVLAEVIRLLESTHTRLGTVTDADLSVFRQRALTPNFDIRNTTNAMLARYYLIAGQHQQAIEAANRVNLAAPLSVFTYPDPDRNPINNYAFGALYVAALQSFVTEAEAGDARPAFWVDTEAEPFAGNPPTIMLLPLRQYGERNDPFPVYLPGEMLLIRAEAQARLNNLDAARELINQVRTQCTTSLIEPAACLPALTEAQLPDLNAVLRQIAYERRYELYMQGLRWEDLRRLGQFAGRQPKAAWLPLPLSECQSNPNINC